MKFTLNALAILSGAAGIIFALAIWALPLGLFQACRRLRWDRNLWSGRDARNKEDEQRCKKDEKDCGKLRRRRFLSDQLISGAIASLLLVLGWSRFYAFNRWLLSLYLLLILPSLVFHFLSDPILDALENARRSRMRSDERAALRWLKTPSSSERLAAVRRLSGCNTNDAIRALARAVADEDPTVRKAATNAVAMHIHLYRHNGTSSSAALDVLRTLEPPARTAAIESLSTALGDENYQIACGAAMGLEAMSSDPRAAAALIDSLDRRANDYRTPIQVIRCLGRIRDRQAVPAIIRHIEQSADFCLEALNAIDPGWTSLAEARLAEGPLKRFREHSQDEGLREIARQTLDRIKRAQDQA